MKLAHLIPLILASSLGVTALHAEAPSAAKTADIIQLLSINGTERIVEPFSSMVTQGYMQSLGNCPTCSPKIPEVVRTEASRLFGAHIHGKSGLIERQVPIYNQRFTHAEIKQLLTFYKSPIGKKMVKESNELMRDTIGASQQWGRDLSPELKRNIDAALSKEGIKPPLPGTPPPSVQQAPSK